jgi:hypothetical protein
MTRSPRPVVRLHITTIALATLLTGCAAEYSPYALHDHPIRFDPAAIPIPDHTPFDTDPARRAVYQHFYWYGYADALAAASSTMCGNDHPWYDAQRTGYYAGQRDGSLHRFPTTSPTP